jgi:hypothetical protein
MEDDDRLLLELSRLPAVEPEAEWEARVRARCHGVLNQQADSRHRARRALAGQRLRGWAAAAALCLYFAAVLVEAVRLRLH